MTAAHGAINAQCNARMQQFEQRTTRVGNGTDNTQWSGVIRSLVVCMLAVIDLAIQYG
jgi:hypothetical protein